MKKYYFNDGTAQQGPFTLEELQAKNITAETPVWYDGLPDWTTAGQVDELKSILIHTPPPFHAVTPKVVEQVKPVTPVAAATVAEEAIPVATATIAEEAVPVASATVAEEAVPVTTATVAATTVPTATTVKTKAPARPVKKSTAWLSYVLGLVVLAGVGYLVYDDMEKNKGNTTITTTMTSATENNGNTSTQPTTDQPTSTMVPDTANTVATTTPTTEPATTTPATTTTTTSTTTPPAVTTTKTTTKPVPAKPTAAEIKAKQLEAQKLAQKKAEEEKKKVQAAEAALAAAAVKERDFRNNWPRYITFGKLDYKDDGDKIAAFDVPVYNGTNAMIDKVTVRVDYMKKDKKVLKSETIFIYNIPPGAGLNGKAPESKKGNNVKVFITGITSRKLHFCFPANNGNPADPYFCN